MVVNCGNFGLKAPEVGAMSGRKYVFFTYLGPFEVDTVFKLELNVHKTGPKCPTEVV